MRILRSAWGFRFRPAGKNVAHFWAPSCPTTEFFPRGPPFFADGTHSQAVCRVTPSAEGSPEANARRGALGRGAPGGPQGRPEPTVARFHFSETDEFCMFLQMFCKIFKKTQI